MSIGCYIRFRSLQRPPGTRTRSEKLCKIRTHTTFTITSATRGRRSGGTVLKACAVKDHPWLCLDDFGLFTPWTIPARRSLERAPQHPLPILSGDGREKRNGRHYGKIVPLSICRSREPGKAETCRKMGRHSHTTGSDVFYRMYVR